MVYNVLLKISFKFYIGIIRAYKKFVFHHLLLLYTLITVYLASVFLTDYLYIATQLNISYSRYERVRVYTKLILRTCTCTSNKIIIYCLSS